MDQGQFSQGGSFALNSAALAAGTTAGTIKTTVALAYTIDAVFYSKAITDNIAFTVSLPATYGVATNGTFTGGAGGTTRLFGIFIDAAGNVSYVPGPAVDSAELAGGRAPLQFPVPQRRKACLGFLRIALTSGTSFIPGTTALGAAGVTATFINAASVPSEPLLA